LPSHSTIGGILIQITCENAFSFWLYAFLILKEQNFSLGPAYTFQFNVGIINTCACSINTYPYYLKYCKFSFEM